MLPDGTRVIFWVDLAIILVVAGLVLAGQWDFVIALLVALVVLNYFDHWRDRHRNSSR